MTTLQLSPREAQVYEMFRTKAKRSIKELRPLYQDVFAPGVAVRRIDTSLSSILHTLDAKLRAAHKGRVERISPRGRGHIGIYQLKKR